ncbi:MAG: hypothetical protein LBU79_02385 [Planctomycetota bacterium]|jgi:predicted DnaQ family exonuclease/DinG family helicase|nr:hypothetical protein [Planctomycetota bacterium]
MNLYPLVVVIDLETTGADPFRDRIIEVGALVLHNGVPGETFDQLVNPGVTLSTQIIRITGITPDMLEGARSQEEVLEEFLAFLPPDAMCIAHNATFDRQFLRQATHERFRHTVMDTVELSRICFPALPSHSLTVLAEIFGVVSDKPAHRALADCEVLAGVWKHLLAKAATIPLPALGEMNRLLEVNPRHPYRDFFQRLAAEQLSHTLGGDGDFRQLFTVLAPGEPRPPRLAEPQLLDRQMVQDWFGPGGEFSRVFPGYENRSGQAEMAVRVADAFNQGSHLMVEAGTGIGKSLAYLAPALSFALANHTPVVVSTNTKNLQAQLFDKDLPLIRKALGMEFRATLLKGRRNYLCLRKLLYLLDQVEAELDQDERMRLLNIIPWSVWTENGDIGENIVAGRPHFAPLWGKLSSSGDECLGRRCGQNRICFLRKARAEAQAADLVVANHSLVMADLNSHLPTLPDYQQLIFDEAHNVEDAVTNQFTVELTHNAFTIPLQRLHRAGRKTPTGLLSGIAAGLAGSTLPEGFAGSAGEVIESTREAVYRALQKVEPFFLTLEAVLANRKTGQSARYTALDKRPDLWAEVEKSRIALFVEIAAILHGLEALVTLIQELDDGSLPYQMEHGRELSAAVQGLRELTNDTVFVLDAASPDYVYWLERTGQKAGYVRAVAAPVAVGALLYEQLYQKKDSVVFCSATLTVKGKFDFMAQRLGVSLINKERLVTFNAGTPYDYHRQCLVLVPVFLPEPGEKDGSYAEELGYFLSDVYRRTEGRGMALFTSYEMLSRVSDIMEGEFLGEGINLLTQGRSGSRESITAIFRRGNRSVLLGTHSFWEGVDIVGDALSCLAIARLPFGVQTDPVVAARCEQVEREGGNAFTDYSLPSAVIRFRQGFGRLIRSREDRGVAIIADRRVAVKRYGQWFRDSLPTQMENFTDRESLLDAIGMFLGNRG